MKTVRIHFSDLLLGRKTEVTILKFLKQKYDVILDEKNPDFLFCFVKNIQTASLGHHRSYDDKCCKIAFTGENVIPDFNAYDYGLGYEYMELGDRYIRCPLQYARINPHILKSWRTLSLEEAKKRPHFCNFIQSHGKGAEDREQFFHLLSHYKHVHSAGKFLRNTDELYKMESQFDLKAEPWRMEGTRGIYRKKFKFTISFENYPHQGYTTEKILNAFMSRTIPIYRGNPRVEEDFVPGSFINVHRFKNLQEVVEEVKRIDNDDDAYMEMLNTHPIPKKYQGEGCWRNKMHSFFCSILDQDPQVARRLPFFPPRKWGRKLSLIKRR